MQKNPIYQFKDENSMGIDTVPNETVILIENYLGGGLKVVLKIGHAGMTIASTVGHFITSTANWVEFSFGSGIPDEVTHKGESLSTVGGATGDTAWTPTLTTPSRLYADLTIPDDWQVNHILAGTFDTAGFILTVPASTTVTIV